MSYLWIPFVILYYILFSWLSKQNNQHGGSWILIMYVYGALWPGWIILSRLSKNLLFDGMLYDNIMFLTYALTMIVLGAGTKFTIHQWVGIGLVIVGSVLIRS